MYACVRVICATACSRRERWQPPWWQCLHVATLTNCLHGLLIAFLPTLLVPQADSLWYSSESSPSTADKVLIRRLEVEGQLLARQQGAGSSSSAAAAGVMLPPLDLSLSKRNLGSIMDVPTAYLCPISMR